MPEIKAKYANFPERELKVVIGPNINATTTKTLSRLSIGTYEMSFVQQERGKVTADAARTAMNHLAKALGLKVTPESHRDFVCTISAANDEHKFQVWVTTPFELTQSGHIIWAKYQELTGDQKIGVAFKLATGFTFDDIETILKQSQKNAVKLAEGEPYTIKGNPPPRFAKKAAVPAAEEAAPATAPVASESEAPPADA
jgi:hypothetical protein